MDWNQNDQPCTWAGVMCAGGSVDKLELSGKDIGGLPNTIVNLGRFDPSSVE
ncbi:MAG: hypothetical protein R3E08_12200 [Thiotrichaceae bacterium]